MHLAALDVGDGGAEGHKLKVDVAAEEIGKSGGAPGIGRVGEVGSGLQLDLLAQEMRGTGAGTGTGKALVIADSANTPRFTVQDNGNVGIGTTDPKGTVPSGFGNTTDDRVLEVRSVTTGGDYGVFIRRSDEAVGLDLWGNDGGGAVYVDSRMSSSPTDGGFYFRTNTASSPSNVMRILANGRVGIGTTSPWRKLSVSGTVGFDGLTSTTGAGSLCLTSNNEVVFNAGSDACLPSLRDTKHDIAALAIDGLDAIERLEPVSFRYNQGSDRERFGFIAEDTAAVAAPLATYDASSTLSGIDDRAILAIVVKAIKELWAHVSERFASHDSRISAQDNRISALEAEVAALKAQLDEAPTTSDGTTDEGSAAIDTTPPASEPADDNTQDASDNDELPAAVSEDADDDGDVTPAAEADDLVHEDTDAPTGGESDDGDEQ